VKLNTEGEALNNKISRRHFSRYIGGGALACATGSILSLSSRYALADSTVSGSPNNPETETLVQYAYFLVPVLAPEHARYRAVADKILAVASQVPPVAALVSGGIAALNASGSGPFLKLKPEQRTEIVHSQEGTPFFGFVHWNTAEIVMRDPQLWQTLGYQGSAIEQGGYLKRGFDDIDWLPEPGRGASE
jgi:hypothetical protein